MSNEVLFFLIAIIDLCFILGCFRLGREWLFASLVINLILVSVLGAKLISIFGFVSNVGNIFYGAVFFATYLLIEHYGKKEGYKTIGIGLLAVMLFVIISQLTLRFVSVSDSQDLSDAMDTLFKAVPRIALGSMVAYFVAQLVNVTIYDYIRKLTGGSLLWLRCNLANVAGQLVDSILFFTIAFWGILPTDLFFQSLFAGFVIKFVVGLLATPFLYVSLLIKPQNENTNQATG